MQIVRGKMSAPAVNACIDHFTGYRDLLLDEEALQQFPIREFALKRNCIVVRVHLYIETEVTGEDFGDQETIAEISFGVLDGVRQVEGLYPLENFPGQTRS
jgi:hypothetical protein